MRDIRWQPAAALTAIRERARLLADIRAFFQRVGVLEVETPICSAHGTTEPALYSLATRYAGPGPSAPEGMLLYLQTSPEFAMKRLLAAGSGPIFQICKVFRDGEFGRLHNPEFTLLEWYRPGYDHHQLMDEVAALVRTVTKTEYPMERLSYADVFQRHCGLDAHAADVDALRSCALTQAIPGAHELSMDANGWRDLLLTHCVEPHLGRNGMTFIYDYPASQASLARVQAGKPPVAERFELYMDGIELANGFSELTDAKEHRRRFLADLEQRRIEGKPPVPIDQNLLAALEAGLPDCAGVALGADRLLMKVLGVEHIDQVLAFPLDRA